MDFQLVLEAHPREAAPGGDEGGRQDDVKAIDGMDAKGVLSQADFEAINAGLGKAIASVPTSKVMDVYNAMAGIVGSSPVPNYLYSQVNPQDAQAAYRALLEFKDVVKAAQR